MGEDSTWMGDRLGTLRGADFLHKFELISCYFDVKEMKMG